MSTINVMRGFSFPLQLTEGASTVAIGNPSIIGVNTLKPELLMINGQETGSTSLTVFGRSGKIYQYRVQVGNDIYQLKALIASLEKKVTVEDFNGTVVLRGEVATPAALTRVLSVADRFVSGGEGEPDFSVISDRGGVLAGNLDEKIKDPRNIDAEVGLSDKLKLNVVSLGGSGGRGGGGSAGGNGAIGALRSVDQPLMPAKGNLAQNISRGNVIMAAKGKVMSLIKVTSQPKVEIQMQIVAIDRNKTDEFGIDWRLDAFSGGKLVTVGSLLGKVSPSAGESPDQLAKDGFRAGDTSLFGFLQKPGKYFLTAFIRALEQKGAGKTLSEPLVTAVSGESASFLVGGNVPIPYQTLSAGNATSNAIVTTNVEYIPFGLRLIVRPTVLENGKISVVLDQSITEPDYSRAIQILGAPIPSFSQRSVSTVTESSSGETWAVAGLLSEEDTKTLKAVPWLSKVPVIGWLFQNKAEDKSRNELMILVNARRIDGENDTTTSFDGMGDLAPKPVVIEDTPKPEEAMQSTSKTQDKPANKKPKQSREIINPSILNNSTTRLPEPKKSLIKPKPANGRNYREIVQPSVLKNPLEFIE